MSTLNQVIKGLQIIAKYEREDSYAVNAEHDIIYAGHVIFENISKEDRQELEKLDWHWDDDAGSWAKFV